MRRWVPSLLVRPATWPWPGRWGWGGVCGGRRNGVAGRACGRGHGSFDAVLNLVRTDPKETVQLAGLATDGGAFVSTTFPDLDDAGRGANGQGLRAQRWLQARQAGRPR